MTPAQRHFCLLLEAHGQLDKEAIAELAGKSTKWVSLIAAELEALGTITITVGGGRGAKTSYALKNVETAHGNMEKNMEKNVEIAPGAHGNMEKNMETAPGNMEKNMENDENNVVWLLENLKNGGLRVRTRVEDIYIKLKSLTYKTPKTTKTLTDSKLIASKTLEQDTTPLSSKILEESSYFDNWALLNPSVECLADDKCYIRSLVAYLGEDEYTEEGWLLLNSRVYDPVFIRHLIGLELCELTPDGKVPADVVRFLTNGKFDRAIGNAKRPPTYPNGEPRPESERDHFFLDLTNDETARLTDLEYAMVQAQTPVVRKMDIGFARSKRPTGAWNRPSFIRRGRVTRTMTPIEVMRWKPEPYVSKFVDKLLDMYPKPDPGVDWVHPYDGPEWTDIRYDLEKVFPLMGGEYGWFEDVCRVLERYLEQAIEYGGGDKVPSRITDSKGRVCVAIPPTFFVRRVRFGLVRGHISPVGAACRREKCWNRALYDFPQVAVALRTEHANQIDIALKGDAAPRVDYNRSRYELYHYEFTANGDSFQKKNSIWASLDLFGEWNEEKFQQWVSQQSSHSGPSM